MRPLQRSYILTALLLLASLLSQWTTHAAPYTDAETEALNRLCQIRAEVFEVFQTTGWMIDFHAVDWAADNGYIFPEWNAPIEGYTVSIELNQSNGILVRPIRYDAMTPRSFLLDYAWRLRVVENADAGYRSPLLRRDPCTSSTGDEAAALRDVVTVMRAQQHLYEQLGFFAGSFEELQDEYHLLNCGWGSVRHGYRFVLNGGGENFTCIAAPIDGNTSTLPALYVDQTGVIRAAHQGLAGAQSDAYPLPYPEANGCLSQIVTNERGVLRLMCEVYEAELNYFNETGYWSNEFQEIEDELSFDPSRSEFGYHFILGGDTTNFSLAAIPMTTPIIGARTFIIISDGMVHSAYGIVPDATITDPIIGQVCELPPPPHTGAPSEVRHHSGDINQDYRLSLTELLRIVQLYNSGGFQCAAGSEDGYAPGTGDETCAPHSADYTDSDFIFDLSELLRAIQLYGGLGYYPCTSGEDGFCGVPRG